MRVIRPALIVKMTRGVTEAAMIASYSNGEMAAVVAEPCPAGLLKVGDELAISIDDHHPLLHYVQCYGDRCQRLQ